MGHIRKSAMLTVSAAALLNMAAGFVGGASAETPCSQNGTTVTCTYQPRPFSIEDVWTSSFYKYALNGIMDDQALKVGGWGDTYCAYIKFAHNPPQCSRPVAGLQSQFPWCTQAASNPLEGLPVTRLRAAQLQLYAYNPGDTSTPTQMRYGFPTVAWDESWAQDASKSPRSFGSNGYFGTLASAPRNSWYPLDISGLYTSWATNPAAWPNRGVALCPIGTSNNFNYFRSSDYTDATLRPKLVLTFDDPTPLDIKMPLAGGQSYLLTTEAGGRDCKYDSLAFSAWAKPGNTQLTKTQQQNFLACEVDPAHSDYTGPVSTSATCEGQALAGGLGTFFSLDFTSQSNGTVYVVAPVDARVTDRASNDPKRGTYVNLSFPTSGPNQGRYEIHMLHLASIDAKLPAKGSPAIVPLGTKIGVMGSSGASTGNHLHISFLYNGLGTSNVEQLTKLRMEGLLLKQYQTECTGTGPQTTRIKSYPSTNPGPR